MVALNRGEEEFKRLLLFQGKSFIDHPLVRLDGFKITPDFFCPKDQIYYEVIATRQAYQQRKHKIEKAKRAGLNIQMVYSPRN